MKSATFDIYNNTKRNNVIQTKETKEVNETKEVKDHKIITSNKPRKVVENVYYFN